MDEKIKETLVGVSKAVLSNIPIAGALLNEVIFDIRGRIVQKRINSFVESFLIYVNEQGISFEDSLVTSETFNDVFISILKRVADTNSEDKLKIFRSILKYNITNLYESNFRETFLDLICRLDYIQIEILKLYRDTGRSGSIEIPEGNSGIVSQVTAKSFKVKITEIIQVYYPYLNTLEIEGKYEFYMCDLISKALLIDTKNIGDTWNDIGKEGLTMLYITDFGKEFIKFIEAE